MTATPRRIHRRRPAVRLCERRLESIADVARTLRRTYRELEAGHMPPNVARAACQVLDSLVRTEILLLLEARVRALENGQVADAALDSHEAALAYLTGGSDDQPE